MILETKEVSKNFGRIQALSTVNISVEDGEVLGVAGPNGAGKSTLFNVIAGVYPPSGGQLIFKGRDITNEKSYRVCHMGIARTFQVPQTFPSLSVYDNVRVGATFGNRHIQESHLRERIENALEILELNDVCDTEAVHLDLYATKLTGLAMSLATHPALLMLDEPLAGLALDEIDRFLKVVKRLNQERVQATGASASVYLGLYLRDAKVWKANPFTPTQRVQFIHKSLAPLTELNCCLQPQSPAP